MTMTKTQKEKQAFYGSESAKKANHNNPFYIMAKAYNIGDKRKIKAGTLSEGSGLSNKELAVVLEEMAEAVDMRCAYTGMPLTLQCRKPNKLSFDRIDNSIGHRPDNMVITSKILNTTRGNDDYETFRDELPKFIRMVISSPLGRDIRAAQKGWGQ